MEKITATAFTSLGGLSEQAKEQLDVGLEACHAFWLASRNNSRYEPEENKPYKRCIFAALAVCDIVNSRSAFQAEVHISGLQVRLLDRLTGHSKRVLAIGHPSGPSGPMDWNAHLVVKIGKLLLDPTLGQASRDWNRLPHIGVFSLNAPAWHCLDIDGVRAKSTSVAITSITMDLLEIAYFKIPLADGFERRPYKMSSNSNRERREIVMAATRLLQDDEVPNLDMAEAEMRLPTVMGSYR